VRLDAMRGAPVFDSSGDKIGSVEEIFYDGQSKRPEWIGIGMGFFGTKRVLVPRFASKKKTLTSAPWRRAK
jgi:sporulation protein YlmC with PRC-barrel domain